MGASFRNIGEIIELAGCDYLTISVRLCRLFFYDAKKLNSSNQKKPLKLNLKKISPPYWRNYTIPKRLCPRNWMLNRPRPSRSNAVPTSTTKVSSDLISTSNRWPSRNYVKVSPSSLPMLSLLRGFSRRRFPNRSFFFFIANGRFSSLSLSLSVPPLCSVFCVFCCRPSPPPFSFLTFSFPITNVFSPPKGKKKKSIKENDGRINSPGIVILMQKGRE